MAEGGGKTLVVGGKPYADERGGEGASKLIERMAVDREISEISDDAAQKALEAVRKRAEGWRAGTATVLGLVLATLALKDVDKSIGAFEGGNRVLLAGLIGSSVVLGLTSLYYLLRAAHGPSWLDTRLKDFALPHDAIRNLRRAESAAKDLRLGQVLLFVAVGAFAAAVGLTWFLEQAATT